MLEMNLQLFGGRGGASGKSSSSGGSTQSKEDISSRPRPLTTQEQSELSVARSIVNSGGNLTEEQWGRVTQLYEQERVNKQEAQRLESKASQLEKEYYTEMSSTGEGNHSVGWRRETLKEIERLRNEASRLKYGE